MNKWDNKETVLSYIQQIKNVKSFRVNSPLVPTTLISISLASVEHQLTLQDQACEASKSHSVYFRINCCTYAQRMARLSAKMKYKYKNVSNKRWCRPWSCCSELVILVAGCCDWRVRLPSTVNRTLDPPVASSSSLAVCLAVCLARAKCCSSSLHISKHKLYITHYGKHWEDSLWI